jgi:hypothetical protein
MRDVAIAAALVALGLGLRVAWFSGYGLGDDANFLEMIRWILETGRAEGAYAYRFTWWAPTVALGRLAGGLTEAAFIAPITLASGAGIAVVYAIGRTLWGRPGGVAAALLLVVHPLDFAWSTMQANDIVASLFVAVAVLGVLRATEAGAPSSARRCWWALAAWGLFLAYHAKVSALTVAPALALIAWWRRDRLWPEATSFLTSSAVLFGGAALCSWALTGNPLAPYEIEMTTAGLREPDAALHHRVTAPTLWAYPRMLLWHDNLGGWPYGFQPILVALAALASRFLPLRTSKEMAAWFVSVFLLMQFQMTVRDGVVVAAFRNLRHSHAFVYPLVLLLAGVFVRARPRWPRTAHAALTVTLAAGLWASIDAASKTRACFADQRAVVWYLSELPNRPIHCDGHLETWFHVVAPPRASDRRVVVLRSTARERRPELAALRQGYLVTGGGREPYYGCWHCIVRAEELPPGRWRLLREFPGPSGPTAWRPEPARVWESVP